MCAVVPDKPSFSFAGAELRPGSHVQEGEQVMIRTCGFYEYFLRQVRLFRPGWRGRLFGTVERVILQRGRPIRRAVHQVHRQARLPARRNPEFDDTPGDVTGVIQIEQMFVFARRVGEPEGVARLVREE